MTGAAALILTGIALVAVPGVVCLVARWLR